jgi:outer membrane lipoprotein YfiO
VKMRRAIRAVLLALCCTGVQHAAHCHTLLDAETAHAALIAIAGYQKEAGTATSPEARAQAWFDLGSRVQTVVDLMNQDIASHGAVDPLAQLVAKRLAAQEIRVVYSESRGRYRYDQDAFRQYLKLAPNGPHRGDARFHILSGAFYATIASDPAQLDAADKASVASAVVEEESFLKEFPRHSHAKDVRFFLGVDCYRLSRNSTERDQATKYSHCARRALEQFVELYPESMEARGASTLLENLSDTLDKR